MRHVERRIALLRLDAITEKKNTETAKQNGTNPVGYVYDILSCLPGVKSPGEWETLVRSRLDPQEVNTAFLADER